jgi:hypothetical protein
LAPELVVFFNNSWVDVGTKSVLEPLVSDITGVTNLKDFDDASIAQKMSWASRRVTTRIEDMAYCLMGLFGINMPLLYGEGEKAFIRLQLEILKVSNDESIFAWEPQHERRTNVSGLLAYHPILFKSSGDIQSFQFFKREPYSMTNQGLKMDVLRPRRYFFKPGAALTPEDVPVCESFKSILNCRREGTQMPLSISLHTKSDKDHCARYPWSEIRQYETDKSDSPDAWESNHHFVTVHIPQFEVPASYKELPSPEFVSISTHTTPDSACNLVGTFARSTSPNLAWRQTNLRLNGPLGPREHHIFPQSAFALLFYTDADDQFVVVLDMSDRRLGAKILTHANHEFAMDVQSGQLILDHSPEELPERISQNLRDHTIGVVITKGCSENRLIWKVDITIHESTAVHWRPLEFVKLQLYR